MNSIRYSCLALLFPALLGSLPTWAQSSAPSPAVNEAMIRQLENQEREAVLHSDSTALFNRLWDATLIVNTPANRVGTVEGTKLQLRTGQLAYLSFERHIETITFNGDLAIVMGEELLRPQGQQLNAGKLVTRRFTNVWRHVANSWGMIVRQATVIKVE